MVRKQLGKETLYQWHFLQRYSAIMKSRVGCFSINVIMDSEEHDLYLSMLSIQQQQVYKVGFTHRKVKSIYFTGKPSWRDVGPFTTILKGFLTFFRLFIFIQHFFNLFIFLRLLSITSICKVRWIQLCRYSIIIVGPIMNISNMCNMVIIWIGEGGFGVE